MVEETSIGYQVLARKYRPATFEDLIGQDAMVRTLKNAFLADRIAHAFVLTGIRGTGKTTTARIVAKGINCIGLDGTGGPTTEPCGACDMCTSISKGRHVDVIEMDAASNTGVANIREIIDSVHYRAASARFKIYIIDEVHMLSTGAFNALLKTLEEPPEHVKFIFATTEIRKIPVTVLSRCQRFDLRRIEPEVMIAHLEKIADLEDVKVAGDALALIARGAEGSVRDAMSLLDQAIAHGVGETTADQVRAMLGLADRGRVLDLFDLVMRGDAAGALEELSGQYAEGADPVAVLRDLAEVTHWVSVIKISPQAADDPTVGPDERTRGLAAAQDLPMRAMTRMWQMLLKALEEISVAPNAMMAAEMAIIRLTHVAELPSPEELVRKLQSQPMSPPSGGGNSAGPTMQAGSGTVERSGTIGGTPSGSPVAMIVGGGQVQVSPPNESQALDRFIRFDQVIDLIRSKRDMKLLMEVESSVRLSKYSPGRIEFQPTEAAPPDLAARLAQRLQIWTGVRWGVSVVSEGGGETVVEQKAAQRSDLVGRAMQHPLVAAALLRFPGSEIHEIKTLEEITADPEDELAALKLDDDWDPFEDD
ncbi:MAG: DNA polymerase III subunit gamma/tau [Amylibacter sp.]|nr:DNA polymerase III subunit gamma/tau [Amylibacter sp.]